MAIDMTVERMLTIKNCSWEVEPSVITIDWETESVPWNFCYDFPSIASLGGRGLGTKDEWDADDAGAAQAKTLRLRSCRGQFLGVGPGTEIAKRSRRP